MQTLIGAGTYFLFVDGYSLEEFGEFELKVRLYEDCEPTCDGALCGFDDQCGAPCGECGAGETCNGIARCVAETCVPQCDGKECGDDGCGASCGGCEAGKVCSYFENVCVEPGVGLECDGMRPRCAPECGAGEYCSSTCECVAFADEALPDMVINEQMLRDEMVISKRIFPETSCAIEEGCVGGTGPRRLLRFTVSLQCLNLNASFI